MKKSGDTYMSYESGLIKAHKKYNHRIMVGIPMTGLLRAEWVMARYGQTIPCNWSQVDMIRFIDTYSPLQFVVADARNIIATKAVEENFEWLFFIDHDTIIPRDTVLKFNERMLDMKVPIWSGLYFTRSIPSEPLIYRGRGNSYYKDWKFGDQVWVDGIPMGCTMIHVSILKALYEESEEYELEGHKVRRIFETPARSYQDPETNDWNVAVGTEDLEFCTRIMNNKIFEKAGWPDYEGKEFPFLVDTSVFCQHIDQNGMVYPHRGEDYKFLPDDDKRVVDEKLNSIG